jgi:hypothetical protein
MNGIPAATFERLAGGRIVSAVREGGDAAVFVEDTFMAS